MITVFLIGNIASGKSTAARYLEACGARRIDLDVLAKELYVPGSKIVREIAREFGSDVIDERGSVITSALAARAFKDAEATARLESIVYPALTERLEELLNGPCDAPLTIVEVSAPVSFADSFKLADAVLAITASRSVRRERAISRGMKPEDFDARSSVQLSESSLCALATSVISNDAGSEELYRKLDRWLSKTCPQLVSNGDAHA